MTELKLISVDTSKHVFTPQGVGDRGEVVLRRELRRQQLEGFFAKLSPTDVVLEACGGSHHWGRVLTALGHRVRLIPPQYVKPFVKRNKNDRADAAAMCEAAARPGINFVPVKSAEQQAAAMVLSVRELLVKQHTQLVNAVRGHAAEFGVIAAKGAGHVEPLLARIADDPAVPEPARAMFAELAVRLTALIATWPAAQGLSLGGPARTRTNPVPVAGGDTRRRPDQRTELRPHGGCLAVQLGASSRRLARPDTEAEVDGGQTAAGRDLAPGQ